MSGGCPRCGWIDEATAEQTRADVERIVTLVAEKAAYRDWVNSQLGELEARREQ